jgi:uncharacterized protein (TIGR02996 family)
MITPDERAARLVLADDLLAKGDPRGELISVQCELERGGLSRARAVTLRKREAELLKANAKAWTNLETWATDGAFRAGFLDEISIDVATFAANEAEIWKRAPYLRTVRFTGFGGYVRLGDAAPPPDQIPVLLEQIFASGRLTGFHALDAVTVWEEQNPLGQDSISPTSPKILEWLVEHGQMAVLRSFSMDDMSESDTCVSTIEKHASRALDELWLSGALGSSIGKSKARPTRLALIDHAVNVRSILKSELASNVRDLEVGPLMIDGTPLVTLTVRKLRGNVRAKDIEAIASSPALSLVEDLTLRFDRFLESVDVLTPLFQTKALESLRVLRIPDANMSSAVAIALLESPLADRLEAIALPDAEPHIVKATQSVGWDGALLLSKEEDPLDSIRWVASLRRRD